MWIYNIHPRTETECNAIAYCDYSLPGPEAVDIICVADEILYTDGTKQRSRRACWTAVSLLLNFLFFFLFFRVSACTGVVHYRYTQVWWHTNTRIRTHNSVGSSYIDSNIASLSSVTLWHYFFNRIKIPGKGFRSGHWSGAGGDGHRLLNKKQRWRREVHRGQPLLLYRRVKTRKKGGGGTKWSLFPWILLHKKVA